MSGRTHRSAPTRWGRRSEPTENWCEDGALSAGRDGARPLQGERSRAGYGGVRLGCGFRQPNSETEFGASVIGIGPYALRGDEGRHAGSSCPTGDSSCCGAQNFCAALRRTLKILTAATRSLRFLCHWQRSVRSPHRPAHRTPCIVSLRSQCAHWLWQSVTPVPSAPLPKGGWHGEAVTERAVPTPLPRFSPSPAPNVENCSLYVFL